MELTTPTAVNISSSTVRRSATTRTCTTVSSHNIPLHTRRPPASTRRLLMLLPLPYSPVLLPVHNNRAQACCNVLWPDRLGKGKVAKSKLRLKRPAPNQSQSASNRAAPRAKSRPTGPSDQGKAGVAPPPPPPAEGGPVGARTVARAVSATSASQVLRAHVTGGIENDIRLGIEAGPPATPPSAVTATPAASVASKGSSLSAQSAMLGAEETARASSAAAAGISTIGSASAVSVATSNAVLPVPVAMEVDDPDASQAGVRQTTASEATVGGEASTDPSLPKPADIVAAAAAAAVLPVAMIVDITGMATPPPDNTATESRRRERADGSGGGVSSGNGCGPSKTGHSPVDNSATESRGRERADCGSGCRCRKYRCCSE